MRLPAGDVIVISCHPGIELPDAIGYNDVTIWHCCDGLVVRDDNVSERDSDNAVVYRQIPAPEDGTEITIGEPVDLFLRSPYSEPRESELDTYDYQEEEPSDSVETNPLEGPDN